MNAERAKMISKFLSLVLRHKPEAIGVGLDEAGWVEVGALLEGMGRAGQVVSREELAEVVAGNDKKRFEFSEDGLRIRARQGHSVEVELGLEPMVPPEELFHGTAARFVEAIRREGLKKMGRQHVHLHDQWETAAAVGRRHGKLVMLRIRAGGMGRAGHVFYRSANGVWLTEGVPVGFLDFLE